MTTSDNNKKGFGGFNDMVSDVTKELEILTAKPTTKPEQPVQEPPPKTPPAPSPAEQKETPNTSDAPKKSSDSSWIWWIIAIFILAATIDSVNKSNDGNSKPTGNEQTNYSNDAVPLEDSPLPAPIQEPILAEDLEEMPSVGNDLVLSHNQIRYCLSENVRLEVINNALNANSQHEIDSFNAAVNDYNSRCSAYKYPQGLLERVQSEVSLNRSSLVVQGLKTLARWRSQVAQPDNIEPPVNLLPSENKVSPEDIKP
jgi:hypothetical protein